MDTREKKTVSLLIWLGVAIAGAGAYATIALQRNERLNSGYILIAALCTYAIGYRFYSKCEWRWGRLQNFAQSSAILLRLNGSCYFASHEHAR